MVGVIPDPADPEWVGGAAMELVRAAADHRRPAFLLDLAPGASDLDARFDAVGAVGFAEAAAGEVELSEIARRDEDHGVAYLPGGLRTPGADLAASPALSTLADRIRRADGVLLVVLDRQAARTAAAEGWPDGWLLVGDAGAAAGGEPLPGDLPELGRIEPRQESGAPEASRWRRHREESSFPRWKVAGGALLLAAVAGAWWWYAGRVTRGGGASSPTAGGPAADTPTATAPGTRAPGERSRPGGAEGDTAEAAAPADAAAPSDAADAAGAPGDEDGAPVRGRELGYSVLIASYASAEDARQRVRRLSSGREGVYFVAPTPVRGALWHRVYAGARPDRASGRTLMERLVELGAKGEVRAWDVRPVPWSFRLPRAFGDSAAALSRARQLHGRGIPAYVLPAGDGESYRVYVGAYESRDAAAALGEQLQEAGIEAELVRRRGAPR